MKCAAAELGEHGIRANAIAPGWVDTNMASSYLHEDIQATGSEFDNKYDAVLRSNMLGAKIQPADIADMALFLASERGRCITAQTLFVCAGLVAS